METTDYKRPCKTSTGSKSLTASSSFESDLSIASHSKPEHKAVDNTPVSFGDYLLMRVLGQGGMGVVYLATQIELQRNVAVKMIRSGGLATQTEVQRFYTEARAAASLRHPNIVSVFQIGEIDGQHFFSMEFLEGESLASRLTSGPLPSSLAAKYVLDLASAIAYAHSQGIIHRDLKPANIIVGQGEHLTITDFGLAKVLHSQVNVTMDGTTLGTPGYMSPEQASGDAKVHGEATDIYSLGAILFALLSGEPPFPERDVAQSIYHIIHHQPPLVRDLRPGVPKDLETIVAKCLSKNPGDRYLTADALAGDLNRFLRSEPISARPLAVMVRWYRWMRCVPIISTLTGSDSPSPTPAHRFANACIAALLLVAALATVFRSPIRDAFNDAILPAHITMGASALSPNELKELSLISKRFESIAGQPLSLITSNDAEKDIQQLETGQVNLAMMTLPEVKQASLKVIAPLFLATVHVVVHDSVAATKLQDLQGKRIAIGSHGSISHQVVETLRQQIPGLFEGMLCVELEGTKILNNEALDAAIIVTPVDTPAINSLLQTSRFRLVELPVPEQIKENRSGMAMRRLSSRDYVQIVGTINTIDIPIVIACKSGVSSKLVNTVLVSIYGHEAHPANQFTIVESDSLNQWPLHPVAQRFFDDAFSRIALLRKREAR
jgi:serine/threonine protein kinase